MSPRTMSHTWLQLVLVFSLPVALGGCSMEAESCEESVAGCEDDDLSPEEKLQQIIDFCEEYPNRPVCKENNLD